MPNRHPVLSDPALLVEFGGSQTIASIE